MNDLGRRILALESRRYARPGSKEQAIHDELGLSSTRYYQLLNGLLDDPEAMVADPLTVKRLRRLQEARRAQRSARADYGHVGHFQF